MSFPPKSHPHSELTGRIIGAAQAAHRELKTGLDEKPYENALCVECNESEIPFEQQKEFPVHYKGHSIGKLRPDLIAAETVIVDAKVVTAFNEAHISQTLGHLNVTGPEVGLLLNFKGASLQVTRVAASQFTRSKSEQSAKSAVKLLDSKQSEEA